MSGLGQKKPPKVPTAGGRMKRGRFSGFDEHIEEQAMGRAMQQKKIAQQTGNSAQSDTGGSALKALGSKQQQQHAPGAGNTLQKPRLVGSIAEEVIVNPIKDVGKELGKFFDLNVLLNIDTSDPPEEQQRKALMLKRWKKLTDAEQEVARQKFQREMQKKQQEEKEKEMKKQQEEKEKKKQMQIPKSPKKGPVGFAGKSKKKKADMMVQMQRQGIGRVGGSH